MKNKLSRREIISTISGISEEVANELEFELVDVEYIKEHGNNFLRIYIYKPEGVTLDDCQKMSKMLSGRLDEIDPIPDAYYLEVSSPGLDRPLKTDKDLKRNLNNEVEIRLYKAIDSIKSYEGVLKSFDEESIFVADNKNNKIEIPRELISIIKLIIKF